MTGASLRGKARVLRKPVICWAVRSDRYAVGRLKRIEVRFECGHLQLIEPKHFTTNKTGKFRCIACSAKADQHDHPPN